MPELNNPQLTDFCNGNLRIIADRLAALDAALPALLGTYNQRNLGTIINDGGPTNLINDGSAVNGRTRVTGGDVFNMVTLLQDLQAFITAGRRDVILKWQVHGVPIV